MRFEAEEKFGAVDGAEFEARLTRALEAAPEPLIAGDFAVRMAARARVEDVPGVSLPTRPALGYGRLAVYLAVPALMVLMLLLARFGAPLSPMTFGIEAMSVAEFVLTVMYLVLRPRSATY